MGVEVSVISEVPQGFDGVHDSQWVNGVQSLGLAVPHVPSYIHTYIQYSIHTYNTQYIHTYIHTSYL